MSSCAPLSATAPSAWSRMTSNRATSLMGNRPNSSPTSSVSLPLSLFPPSSPSPAGERSQLTLSHSKYGTAAQEAFRGSSGSQGGRSRSERDGSVALPPHPPRRGADLARPTRAGTTEDVDRMSRRQVKVTKEHNEECRRLLTLMGIPWVEVRAPRPTLVPVFPSGRLHRSEPGKSSFAHV